MGKIRLRLSERKALLAEAAVVGRTFWAGAVAAVGPHGSPDVFEGLHELVARAISFPPAPFRTQGDFEQTRSPPAAAIVVAVVGVTGLGATLLAINRAQRERRERATTHTSTSQAA